MLNRWMMVMLMSLFTLTKLRAILAPFKNKWCCRNATSPSLELAQKALVEVPPLRLCLDSTQLVLCQITALAWVSTVLNSPPTGLIWVAQMDMVLTKRGTRSQLPRALTR